MADKTITWYKIADDAAELAFAANQLLELDVNGKTICLARQDARIRACAAKCPHAGGHMAEGWIDALGNIVCPLHRYKFSLEKGRNVSGEGYFLKTYPVEIRVDGVYVGLEAGGLFNWLK